MVVVFAQFHRPIEDAEQNEECGDDRWLAEIVGRRCLKILASTTFAATGMAGDTSAIRVSILNELKNLYWG